MSTHYVFRPGFGLLLIFIAAALTLMAAARSVAHPALPSVSSTVAISEFRASGPSGSYDEFVELYNTTGSPINIGDWKINASDNAGTVSTRVTISTGTTIPAYGHFLATNRRGYSKSVPGDQTYSTGIADDGGIGLLDSAGNIVDGVGLSLGSAYGEGTRLEVLGGGVDSSYERLPGGSFGSWQDTDDNFSDFAVLSPSDPQSLSSVPVPPSSATPTSTATAASTSTSTRTATQTNTFTPAPTLTPTLTPTGIITLTSTPTPTCIPAHDYTITQSLGATIVPGTVDTGNHCNDCVTTITLPFAFRFYDIEFPTAILSSNGNLQFDSNISSPDNSCLPITSMDYAILPYWTDLLTTELRCTGCGIFTSVSGSEPNRIFNIEWRACVSASAECAGDANFEIRLYEFTSRFDVIYGAVYGSGATATVGAQRAAGIYFTEYECNAGGIAPGLQLTFTMPACAPVSPTATPSVGPTGTSAPSPTATNTPSVPPAATTTSTATASPTRVALLVGHVTWQGRPAQPSARQELPITLTVKSSAVEVNYPVQTTDASGFFTVSVAGLTPGTYTWRAKGPKYLAAGGSVVVSGSPETVMELGIMRVGDSNDDNRIDVSDFNIVKNSFGRALGDPGYDDRGDFNGDNRVNIADFNLQRGNFGLAGAPPIRPGRW